MRDLGYVSLLGGFNSTLREQVLVTCDICAESKSPYFLTCFVATSKNDFPEIH